MPTPPASSAESTARPPAVAVAMVLAAGHGTRLRPLTDVLPKPLVPIGDRPMLHHVLERLRRAGVARAVVNTHHQAAAFRGLRVGDLPLPLELVHETDILGTAGGVHNARHLLGDGCVLVWNGDILADVDVGALLDAHRKRGAYATLAVSERPREGGTVGIDETGRVVRLRSERYGREVRAHDFVGVQLLSAESRLLLPAEGCLVADALQPALRRGAPVITAPVVRRWTDIGTVQAYLDAHRAWLAERELDHWIGPRASVGRGVTLRGSVVGEGATVVGHGAVDGCVVWPGAKAVAPLTAAVVASADVVATAGR